MYIYIYIYIHIYVYMANLGLPGGKHLSGPETGRRKQAIREADGKSTLLVNLGALTIERTALL